MFRNLCISGAGTQGPALIGAISELSLQGKLKNVRDMCGVSFGAILAMLLSIGWKPEDIYNRTKDIDVSELCTPNVRLFFDKFGLASTDKLMEYIDELVEERGIDKNITFRNHIYKTDVMLRIPALCLNTCKMVFFSHLTHPDLPIRDAIRASISIPLLYNSHVIDDKHYIDGGVVRNIPYDPYIGHEELTIGVAIESNEHDVNQITNIQAYIGALLSSLHENANYVPPSFSHLIRIRTNHTGTNFSIKREDIEEMMNIGKEAIKTLSDNPTSK